MSRMRSTLGNSLIMGGLCAALGAATAGLIFVVASGEDYGRLLLAAPLAAFFTGASLWWLIMARPARAGTSAGAVTGALSGILAHYVCWYLLILGASACYTLTGGCTDSLGQPPFDPLAGIPAAGVLSLFSLIFVGWLTVPAGALAGGLLARRTRTRPCA